MYITCISQIDNKKIILGDHEKINFIINHILFATKQCIHENMNFVNPRIILHVKINIIKDATCPKCGLHESIEHLIY